MGVMSVRSASQPVVADGGRPTLEAFLRVVED